MDEQKKEFSDFFSDLKSGLSNVGSKMNQMIDDVFKEEAGEAKQPTDIYETDALYVIEIELAGVDKSDVNIHMSDNVLLVKGGKNRKEESADAEYHQRGRAFGVFSRSFDLPLNIETEGIKAKFEAGVLSIRFPKIQAEEEEDEHSVDIDII